MGSWEVSSVHNYYFQSKIIAQIFSSVNETKTKFHGLSPGTNYTDRATTACRRSDCQIFADRGCHVVSVTDPYGSILGFLERSRYFSIT
jgi:hypothetical protein